MPEKFRVLSGLEQNRSSGNSYSKLPIKNAIAIDSNFMGASGKKTQLYCIIHRVTAHLEECPDAEITDGSLAQVPHSLDDDTPSLSSTSSM